jgi:hypothetical protein
VAPPFSKNTEINSEKLRHHICILMGNNQFFVSPWLAMRTANAVFDIQANHRKPIKHAANIGMAVNAVRPVPSHSPVASRKFRQHTLPSQ